MKIGGSAACTVACFPRYHVTGRWRSQSNNAHRPRPPTEAMAPPAPRKSVQAEQGVNLEAGEGGVHPGAGPQINRPKGLSRRR